MSELHQRTRTPTGSTWAEHPDNEPPEDVSTRLGISIEAAREHTGQHRCVDEKLYSYSCLVSDPSCDAVARSYMNRTIGGDQ